MGMCTSLHERCTCSRQLQYGDGGSAGQFPHTSYRPDGLPQAEFALHITGLLFQHEQLLLLARDECKTGRQQQGRQSTSTGRQQGEATHRRLVNCLRGSGA